MASKKELSPPRDTMGRIAVQRGRCKQWPDYHEPAVDYDAMNCLA
jgi:hypothetical protein